MGDKKKNSVLIVDDEDTNIMALTHILNPEYTVLAVKDGQDAIEVAEEYHPDIILLDVVMPEMDGYAVISALKKSEKTQNIPVIFITGLNNPDDEERGLSLGAADYISKPFSPAVVKLRVYNHMQIINQTHLIIEKDIAEKSSRAKADFLSRMSHEMHTPMNAIMGMIQLLENTNEAGKRADCLEKINFASRQLLQLIDDLLDIYDIENGKLRLVNAEFSFQAVIRETIDKISVKTNKKRQVLAADINSSIPDALVGDGKRLAQVIFNLLSNAEKFTPEQGSIQLNAFVRETSNDTLTIQVEVTDNGIGISKEQQKNLFTTFEQVDGGISRKFGGAGLGLAIAQYIIGLMGGEIGVESEEGKGAKFTFSFKTHKKQLNQAKQDEPVSFAGKTALLVDDVEINREIIMALMENTGMEIECAVNGKEAFELFSAHPQKIDVILMDVNMPVMDGVEATRRIRALETQKSAHIPIVAMTANTLTDEVEKYMAAGMNDYVGKPVNFEELTNVLCKYLK
ncbi:MAG: response regulator [Treponema sp.]|jgi:CheY-like chemotaxis protein|nr:response regulator [Treponema sp.]